MYFVVIEPVCKLINTQMDKTILIKVARIIIKKRNHLATAVQRKCQ
jgi:hypothetical protein